MSPDQTAEDRNLDKLLHFLLWSNVLLIIKRTINQSHAGEWKNCILIADGLIEIKVLGFKEGEVKIGINAPRDISIRKGEDVHNHDHLADRARGTCDMGS